MPDRIHLPDPRNLHVTVSRSHFIGSDGHTETDEFWVTEDEMKEMLRILEIVRYENDQP